MQDISTVSTDALARRLASARARRDAHRPGTEGALRWQGEVRAILAELTQRRAARNVARFVNDGAFRLPGDGFDGSGIPD